MLNWAARFNIFCFLDNQGYAIQPHRYECLLGAGVKQPVNIFSAPLQKGSWYFGHLSYDLKNELHGFTANKEDRIGFPLFFFFVPQFTLFIKEDQLVIEGDEPEAVYQQIMVMPADEEYANSAIPVQQKLTREEYIEKVKALQKHIQLGDCYEINFCQEFFAEDVRIEPVSLFQRLMAISPNPFSAFYRLNDSYLMCASPERFLMKSENKVLSQPMKGTIKRNVTDGAKDDNLKEALRQSKKDQSENVMVVDLVRNDLSRVCKKSSVRVDELFGVYTYPQVHQMISTISGELKEAVSFQEIIKATFPMGSMTGAPKHKVMQLIDEYEVSSRGIFSGSVGYISPEDDFDLNVVIRSIMYNAASKYLSYQVGSGITFYSDPQGEWEECLLKAEAIKKVLAGGPAL